MWFQENIKSGLIHIIIKDNIKPWKINPWFFVFIKYYLYICIKNKL